MTYDSVAPGAFIVEKSYWYCLGMDAVTFIALLGCKSGGQYILAIKGQGITIIARRSFFH